MMLRQQQQNDLVIPTANLTQVRRAFTTVIENGRNLWIAGSRHAGKSFLLDQLQRELVGHYSFVFQAGVPPAMREEIGKDIVDEFAAYFELNERVILFLDEFDGQNELNQLWKDLKQYRCTLVIASNHSHIPDDLQPCELVRLSGIENDEEAKSVLRDIAASVSKSHIDLETVQAFLCSVDRSPLPHCILQYSKGVMGTFIVLATRVLLAGAPFHCSREMLGEGRSESNSVPTRTVRKTFQVVGRHQLKARQHTIVWGNIDADS